MAMGILDPVFIFYANAKRMLKTQSIYSLLGQVLNLCMVVTTALMMWQALILYTGSESPVVVVLSGSMEPTFYRGDILLLHNRRSPEVGDIVVFKIEGRDIPIVHRAIEVHVPRPDSGKELRILTKGDNNEIDDRIGGIYERSQMWITPKEVMGVAHSWIPIFGYLTVKLNEIALLKYGVLLSMTVWVLFTREE